MNVYILATIRAMAVKFEDNIPSYCAYILVGLKIRPRLFCAFGNR